MNGVPPPTALATAYRRIAGELGLAPKASEAAITIALREADHLADDVYDLPGALLFALGRTRRCFAGFRTMSVLVVEARAKSLGFKLEATPVELADVLLRVAVRDMPYEEVRAWTADRLFPFGG